MTNERLKNPPPPPPPPPPTSHKKSKQNNNNNSNNNLSLNLNEPEEKINHNGKKERSSKDKSLKIRLSNLDGNGGFVHDDIQMDEDLFSDKSYRKIKKIKKNSNNNQRFEPVIEKPQKGEEEIFVEEYN